MSTEAVQSSPPVSVGRQPPVTAKPFEVPTAPSTEAQSSGGIPKTSFDSVKPWNESPMRGKADAAIKKALAGGPDLSPQDKELLRRNIMLVTQGGDFDQAAIAGLVGDMVGALRDPNRAEATRVDLWAQQAAAFGGMYVPDQYKQAVAERLRGGGSPVAPSDVPAGAGAMEGVEPSSDDVPVDTEEAPVEQTDAPAQAKPAARAAPSATRTPQDILQSEWTKLSGGGDTIPLSAMMPILQKIGIQSEEKVADLLRQQGIDPAKITQPQYMQARVELLKMALTRMASAQKPDATPDQIAGMVKEKLPLALEQTTI